MGTRAHINLDTMSDVNKLVKILNSDGTTYKYTVENADGLAVDARSLLGVMYASAEFSEKYLVNKTADGVFPSGIDELRKIG